MMQKKCYVTIGKIPPKNPDIQQPEALWRNIPGGYLLSIFDRHFKFNFTDAQSLEAFLLGLQNCQAEYFDIQFHLETGEFGYKIYKTFEQIEKELINPRKKLKTQVMSLDQKQEWEFILTDSPGD